MATLKDFKVGDRVRMWRMIPIGGAPYITTQAFQGNSRFETTIIGQNRHSDSILGWKTGEEDAYGKIVAQKPKLIYPEGYSMLGDLTGFSEHTTVTGGCEAELISGTEQIKKIAEKVPDWKRFQNSVPGECPCGTTRSMCHYHK